MLKFIIYFLMDGIVYFKPFVHFLFCVFFLWVPKKEAGNISLGDIVRIGFQHLKVKALQLESIFVDLYFLDFSQVLGCFLSVWWQGCWLQLSLLFLLILNLLLSHPAVHDDFFHGLIRNFFTHDNLVII